MNMENGINKLIECSKGSGKEECCRHVSFPELLAILEAMREEDKPDDKICEYCGGLKAIRNPTGNCDHLYYPENVNKNFPNPSSSAEKRQWLREWVTTQIHGQNRRIGELEAKAGTEKLKPKVKAEFEKIDARLCVVEEMMRLRRANDNSKVPPSECPNGTGWRYFQLVEHNSVEQMNLGGFDDTRKCLVEGHIYKAMVEEHSLHTVLYIETPTILRRFNSVCFREIFIGTISEIKSDKDTVRISRKVAERFLKASGIGTEDWCNAMDEIDEELRRALNQK